MHRSTLLLTPVLFLAPLLAQSADSHTIKEGRYALVTLTKYCDAVEDFSNSRQPRLFAQVPSGAALSSQWVEFSSRDAWTRAGKPKPLALVWYKDDVVTRVAISEKDGGDHGRSYTDYCYRPDGSLARLRSVPEMQTDCDPSFLHCSSTFRGERLYAPMIMEHVNPSAKPTGRRPLVVQSDAAEVDDPILRPLKPESSSFLSAPVDSPEYLSVGDLPFVRLLYVSTRPIGDLTVDR
jgi:hypothetical protein